MRSVKILSSFIIIMILFQGCVSTKEHERKNSDEIEIVFLDDVYYNSSILLNYHYQVRLNFTNHDLDSINLSLEDFMLISKSNCYYGDSSPNIPENIHKNETVNFVISFDTDNDEEYKNFKKIIYESKSQKLYYEIPIPK
jgi:hypothetical protein